MAPSIPPGDLNLYGSSVMPDDDTVTGIGGAIDGTKVLSFINVNGPVQAVCSVNSTHTITIIYLTAAGLFAQETITLTTAGTVVPFTTTPVSILKATRSSSGGRQVAIESQTATRTGTAAAGGGANNEISMIMSYDGKTKIAQIYGRWFTGFGSTITLDSGASSVDGFYVGQIVRMTSGAGAFRISPGILFDSFWNAFGSGLGATMQVRRPFYNAIAPAVDGPPVTYYEKCFWFNQSFDGRTLRDGVARLLSDPTGGVTFGLATSLNDSGTNGGGNNRKVAPASIVFSAAGKPCISPIAVNNGQGMWLALALSSHTAFDLTPQFALTGATP